jgi:rod shape-determining protein MreD
MTTMLPALSVLFAVLATAVPWGLPADATFILPFVVVMMVFCWRTIPGAVLLPAVAVLLGLLVDIVSGGPLGYWALMALIGATAGGHSGPLGEEGHNVVTLWLIWTALVCTLAGFGWVLASVYFFRWIDWWPILLGALASVSLFPVVLQGIVWIRYGRLGHERSPIYRGWA